MSKSILKKSNNKPSYQSQIIAHFNKHRPFYLLNLLLILLLFKNPFSGQNAISSLEPFPDASLYLNMARNITDSEGFKITYKQVTLYSTIPPLYPLSLVPFYAIFDDPRSFYLTNLVLTLVSSFLFYQILLKLFKRKFVIFLLQLTFITSSIIFTYPAYAMSENLLICLFIASVYLLTGQLSVIKSVTLGILTTAFVSTKYVAWPLSLSLLIIFLVGVIIKKHTPAEKITWVFCYSVSFILSFFLFLLADSYSKQQNIFELIKIYSNSFLSLTGLILKVSGTSLNSIQTNPTFSTSYVSSNLLRYFAVLIGGTSSLAGKELITIPPLVGIASLAGIVLNPFTSKFKLVSSYLLLAFITTLLFIMLFFANDIRYIFITIPIQILSYGILLNTILQILESKKLTLSYYLILLISLLAISTSAHPHVKNQLLLNFFTPEYSRPYETVNFYNQNFKNSLAQKPKIITVLPPVMVNFYSNKNYDLLPFSRYQNFITQPHIWNLPENPDLINIYKEFLKNNQTIYLSDYLADSYYFSQAFLLYQQNFNLAEVSSGCSSRCKLYQLKLKID